MLKRTIAVVLLAGTLALNAAPAAASPWTGTCVLNLTFNFGSPVRPAGLTVSRPNYSISVDPAADLNPTAGGIEPCVVAPGGINPFRQTSVIASGSSTVWTCEATDAGGRWDQSWLSSPPSVIGSHVIVGGPEGWSMLLHNHPSLTFVGNMELTVHPDDALKLAQCELGGISSLRMTGVLEFQMV